MLWNDYKCSHNVRSNQNKVKNIALIFFCNCTNVEGTLELGQKNKQKKKHWNSDLDTNLTVWEITFHLIVITTAITNKKKMGYHWRWGQYTQVFSLLNHEFPSHVKFTSMQYCWKKKSWSTILMTSCYCSLIIFKYAQSVIILWLYLYLIM